MRLSGKLLWGMLLVCVIAGRAEALSVDELVDLRGRPLARS
jgi:hypothetical protein